MATRMAEDWQEWQDRAWEPRPTHQAGYSANLCCSAPLGKNKTKKPSAAPRHRTHPRLARLSSRGNTSPPERKAQGDGGAVETGRPVLPRPVPSRRGRRERGREAGGGVWPGPAPG